MHWGYCDIEFFNRHFVFIFLMIFFIVWTRILSWITMINKHFIISSLFKLFLIFCINSSITCIMIMCTSFSSLAIILITWFVTLSYFILQRMVQLFKKIMRKLAFIVLTVFISAPIWTISHSISHSSSVFRWMIVNTLFIVMSNSYLWAFLRLKSVHIENFLWEILVLLQ